MKRTRTISPSKRARSVPPPDSGRHKAACGRQITVENGTIVATPYPELIIQFCIWCCKVSKKCEIFKRMDSREDKERRRLYERRIVPEQPEPKEE